MRLEDMSLLAASPRHKIIPVVFDNDNETSKRLPVGFDDDYSVITTTKACSAGIWTVRVCNGTSSAENTANNSGIMTRSCAVRSFTQSRLDFGSPPKMIIKLSRRDCSTEPCKEESSLLAPLTNGHFHSATEPATTAAICGSAQTSSHSAQRRKSCGRSGRRRKTALLPNRRTTQAASKYCASIVPLEGSVVNGYLSCSLDSDTAVNGCASEAVAPAARLATTAAPVVSATSTTISNHNTTTTTTTHALNGGVHLRRGLSSPLKLRNAKHKRRRMNGAKAGYTAVTSSSRNTLTDSRAAINSLMTDFFPVRRSSRTTSEQIKKREKQEMEEFVLSAKEEGLKVVEISGKGRGVVTWRPFARGEYLVEYAGELVDHAVAKEREERYSLDQRLGCYMYYFSYKDRKYCVDATKETPRLGRLINHSRLKPNCATKIIEIGGRPRLVFVALRRIEANEELLYDYGDRDRETLGSHPWLAY